jgi:hypothetical protein
MKTSIWYHTADRNPDQSGYYLSYRGWGIAGKGDGDHDLDYLYYHKGQNVWVEYEGAWRSTHFNTCIVYYWTDADPAGWVDDDVPLRHRKKHKEDNPALNIAWQKVEQAIAQYELIKSLVGTDSR